MITSLEKLKEFIKLNKAPYWTLYRGTGLSATEKVSEVDHYDTNVSMADSLSRLEQVFDVLGGGRYSIKAKTKHNDIKAGVYTEYVDISEKPASIGALSGGGISKSDLQEALAEERKKWDTELKIQKLETENAVLKKQSTTDKIIAGFMNGIEPILIKGLAKVSGVDLNEAQPSVAVSGFAKDEQATPEEMKRVQVALEKLAEFLEPKGYNVVDVLEKLAHNAETNPQMIIMALKMLQ